MQTIIYSPSVTSERRWCIAMVNGDLTTRWFRMQGMWMPPQAAAYAVSMCRRVRRTYHSPAVPNNRSVRCKDPIVRSKAARTMATVRWRTGTRRGCGKARDGGGWWAES
ncbi:hypothetical protein C8Q80DRAFT_246579 [Daedaleopsis nitida]|nr:hypothetical protein C8Q80DRAFT_246579 [Daedaleopsis nitida]